MLIIPSIINGFRSSKGLTSSNRTIDNILTGTTTPGQSRPGSNTNEVVLHIFQSSRTGTTPSDTV